MKNSINKNKLRKNLFLITILAYPLTLFIIFYVVVNFNSLLLAFQKMNNDYSFSFDPTFTNFKNVFSNLFESTDSTLWIAFRNSILRFIIITGIGMPLNILFSYYVHVNFAGSKIFKVIVMIPTVISAMLMALITQKMIYKIPALYPGFPNLLTDQQHVFMTTTIYSLWVGFSTALIIYPNQINAIDKELIESAQLDGATHLQIIWYVVLPLLIPTISTFIVTGVAGILSDMGPLYSFFGLEASKNASLTGYIIYQLTIKYKKPQYGYVSALGLLCTVLALPVTLIVKKIMDRIDPMEEHIKKQRRRG